MVAKKRILFPLLTVVIFSFSISSLKAKETNLVSRLNLSKEQTSKLSVLIEEFNTQVLDIVFKIDNKFLELRQDLKREDRFDTRSKARTSARNVNKLVKNISSLYGDLLKLRVEYLLKAKNIFTDQQKAVIVASLLDFNIDTPDNFSYYLDVDLTALGLDLTKDQVKKLLKYRADMDVMGIKLELNINYKLLDLKEEIISEDRDPQKIDKIIITIIDIGTKLINNRVDHILKAKDVLTVEQKKKLLHMMLMT